MLASRRRKRRRRRRTSRSTGREVRHRETHTLTLSLSHSLTPILTVPLRLLRSHAPAAARAKYTDDELREIDEQNSIRASLGLKPLALDRA